MLAAPGNTGTASVWCACGAQWHGEAVAGSREIIAGHKARWSTGTMGCGPITHAGFRARVLCACDDCREERAALAVLRRTRHADRRDRDRKDRWVG